MLTPWPWAGRVTARSTAAHLAAVIADLEGIDPPHKDADAVEAHYLTPLRKTLAALADVADGMPLGVSLVDAVTAMDREAPVFPNDVDHNYVVDHGLPPWWLPKTDAWERRG